MGDVLGSIFRVAMIVLVVGPVTAWVMRAGKRERDAAAEDTERFTVCAPVALRRIFAACAVLFELLMLAVYTLQGFTTGEWDHALIWLGHGLALASLGIMVLIGMPRIDVDGDGVSARNVLGMRRRTHFSQIVRATVNTQMMSIALYTARGKFASISLESVCADNLLRRLDKEGIEVADAVQGSMTKARLCWLAIKPLATVFMGIAAASSLVIVILVVFANVGVRVLWMVPFLFVLLGALLPICMLGLPARGIYHIGCQERELGFSFAKEMDSRGATGAEYEDEDWFISISNARVVAFRRDYIKSVSVSEGSDSGDRCVVVAKSCRKHKVYAAQPTLADLRSWFRGSGRGGALAKKRTMTERAERALETI